jgi:hypothetical protein
MVLVTVLDPAFRRRDHHAKVLRLAQHAYAKRGNHAFDGARHLLGHL